MRNTFWSGNIRERDHVDLDIDESITSKRNFEKKGVKMGTGLKWFKIGSNGGRL
jgi:hypothetical protein